MAHKVILPPKKNYIPQFLKQRDINSYYMYDTFKFIWIYDTLGMRRKPLHAILETLYLLIFTIMTESDMFYFCIELLTCKILFIRDDIVPITDTSSCSPVRTCGNLCNLCFYATGDLSKVHTWTFASHWRLCSLLIFFSYGIYTVYIFFCIWNCICTLDVVWQVHSFWIAPCCC